VRSIALALLTGLLTAGGFFVPAAALADGPAPKVVIIVGPVAGTTPSYRSDADAAAAEALRYTPNVIKIYSPNATWAVVKSALQGASIVIYMGHGNGFPSPRTATLMPDRQDGLGLNPVAGKDDSTTQYWGERYLASDIRLAPNAVVILGHLCYASGSSEPGHADPTLSVARQRVDNFAAGFLAAGARAVIADAHGGASAAYIRALFTGHQSLGDLWLSPPFNNGNSSAFASTRTPGMTAQLDPDASSGPYYRSFVGDVALLADSVVGNGAAIPSADPGSDGSAGQNGTGGTGQSASSGLFTVPGPAIVTADHAGLYGDPGLTPEPATGLPPATLPSGTPVRILAQGGSGPDGQPVFAVATADGSRSGYMSATVLRPAQSGGPVATAFSAPTLFSPNGDGRQDTFPVRATFKEPVTWQLTVVATNGSAVAALSGSGTMVDFAWDGQSNGTLLPDGTYSYRLAASDAWGHPPFKRTGTLRIDTLAPTLAHSSAATDSPAVISPNGDGQFDTWTASFRLNEAGRVEAVVAQPDGTVVRNLSAADTGGQSALKWDARSDKGGGVADGRYTIVITGRDKAGNASRAETIPVTVYRALGVASGGPDLFYPQDGDALAPITAVGFNLLAEATVSVRIVDGHGAVVATLLEPTAAMAGYLSLPWAGLGSNGQMLPAGTYAAEVTATDGVLTNSVAIPLTLGAFRISTSTSVATRGNNLTITVVSAEPLGDSPRVTLTQPGFKARTVTMVPAGAMTYRVTTRIQRGGKAGKLSLKVTGSDVQGGINTSATSLTLR